MFNENELALQHTFELRNTTDETIHVQKVASTCGCTVGFVAKPDVSPGEMLRLEATLKMRSPGHRNEQIRVLLQGWGVLTLSVEGTARRVQGVVVSHRAVLLVPNEAVDVVLAATDHDADSEPPSPQIEAPSGVSAEFRGWDRIYTLDRDTARPARWHGVVRILGNHDPSEVDAVVTIAFRGDQTFGVRLDGRTW